MRRCYYKKKPVKRKEIREALENFNACCELLKLLRHFFPDLIPMLKQVSDPRHQSYTDYENYVLLFVRILGAVFHIGSMRKISVELNNKICISNVAVMLKHEDLQELPYWETINNYLKLFSETELENIIQQMVYRLIRMRSFENSRIRDKYWHIVIDGTQIYSSNERHCPYCLTREHKDKETGKVKWTEYYHCVLEAKLVINNCIVISIATEFIENEEPDAPKQDCEQNAFYRLAKKLKQRFPRLPICLGMDSLYACGPVFDIIKQNNWHFIIRFKDGSLPSVAEEFHALKTMEPEQIFTKTESGTTKTYRYVTRIPYQAHTLNVVEYVQSDLGYPFVFITDLSITKKNYEHLVEDGRRRWKIENEGFNAQKNHGYELKHLFSKDYTAMKNHYLLTQIGHMIGQFYEHALEIWKLIKMPAYEIYQSLKQSFKSYALKKEDTDFLPVRYRFGET